jgi:hypothetical protein
MAPAGLVHLNMVMFQPTAQELEKPIDVKDADAQRV